MGDATDFATCKEEAGWCFPGGGANRKPMPPRARVVQTLGSGVDAWSPNFGNSEDERFEYALEPSQQTTSGDLVVRAYFRVVRRLKDRAAPPTTSQVTSRAPLRHVPNGPRGATGATS